MLKRMRLPPASVKIVMLSKTATTFGIKVVQPHQSNAINLRSGATIAIRLVSVCAALVISCQVAAQTTLNLGETHELGYADSGNANLDALSGPYVLNQKSTIQSISFWVSNSAGKLYLGVYDASGPNGSPGNLVAQTALIALTTANRNTWVTAPTIAPVTLNPGSYYLAYLPSSNRLSFREGLTSGVTDICAPEPFSQGLPLKFPNVNDCGDGAHWSEYATLTPITGAPTLSVSFTPMNPSIPANAVSGSQVAAVNAMWSDGSQFMGTLGFTSPYGDDNGTFILAGNEIEVSGSGVSGDGATTQNLTVQAVQGSTSTSANLSVIVTQSRSPTIVVTIQPSNPSVPNTAAIGTQVATIVPRWSDGSTFTGSCLFVSPDFNDGGLFSLGGANNCNIIVGASLKGLAGTEQNVTVEASQ